MKKEKIPKVMLWIAIVLTASTFLDSQAQQVTFSNGSGTSGGSTTSVSLTIGQGVIGRSGHGFMSHTVAFGFWEMNRNYFVSAVGEGAPALVNHLFRNYPNPFNPSTRISYTLEKEAAVQIGLYDLKGRKVDSLLHAVKPAGAHSFSYQPDNLASGVYFVLMRAGSYRATQRIMLVK